jgi:hypothetical protein
MYHNLISVPSCEDKEEVPQTSMGWVLVNIFEAVLCQISENFSN